MMAYEGWYICDTCGKKVNREDDDTLKHWIRVDIDYLYVFDDKREILSTGTCGFPCAIEGIKKWLTEQE